MESKVSEKHYGPHPGVLAGIFMVLFNTGLYFVISLSGKMPYFPGPWESAPVMAAYFQNNAHDARLCAFFQFVSAIPLGIFTATIVSRLQFLRNRAPGTFIAMFGGFMTAFNLVCSALVIWVMSYPGIAQNVPVLRALYYFSFAIGGVGYSVPIGLLIAGISVTSYFTKTLPKWMVWFGVILALIGEASSLTLVFPKLLPLIPLTRFPGFIWLIIAGFKLPVNRMSGHISSYPATALGVPKD